MKVDKAVGLGGGHSVEMGEASWGGERSIRNRYPNSRGGFNPHASSELSFQDLVLLCLTAIEEGELSPDQQRAIKAALEAEEQKRNQSQLPLFGQEEGRTPWLDLEL